MTTEERRTTEDRVKWDKWIGITLTFLTIVATLIAAVPGFLSLKPKHSIVTYGQRISGVAFPTNADRERIKRILDKEGIPDSTFGVTVRNSGELPASDVRIAINVPGKVIAVKSVPSPQDNPPWVEIMTEADPTKNPSLVRYNLRNLAIGPQFEIEVSYSSNGLDQQPRCEIYADGFPAVPAEITAAPLGGSSAAEKGIVVFLLGTIVTFVVVIWLRMKRVPELRPLLISLAAELPYIGTLMRTGKAAAQFARVAMAAPAERELPPNGISHTADAGSIYLNAGEASLHGNAIRFEEFGAIRSIGYWTSKDDYVTWGPLKIPKTTDFAIFVDQACKSGSGGEYAIVIGSQKVTATVRDTGGWPDFVHHEVGRVRLEGPAEYTLKAEPIRIKGGALMNVRAITLHAT